MQLTLVPTAAPEAPKPPRKRGQQPPISAAINRVLERAIQHGVVRISGAFSGVETTDERIREEEHDQGETFDLRRSIDRAIALKLLAPSEAYGQAHVTDAGREMVERYRLFMEAAMRRQAERKTAMAAKAKLAKKLKAKKGARRGR